MAGNEIGQGIGVAGARGHLSPRDDAASMDRLKPREEPVINHISLMEVRLDVVRRQLRHCSRAEEPCGESGQLRAVAVAGEPSDRGSGVSSELVGGWAGSSANAIRAPAAATPAAR